MSSVFALEALGGVGVDEQAVYPDILLEVDWDNDGIFEGGNEDLSAQRDVRMVECWRGRDTASNLVGRSMPGHLFGLLNNDDDRYNADNSGSPLFGNLVPGRETRLRATTPFPIEQWHGFSDEIRPRIMETREKRAELPAAGPLARIAGKRVSVAMKTSYGTGAAIGDILDDASWPAADRVIDTGQTTMDRWWTDRTAPAISAAREVEDTESGFLAESHDGKILFEDRHHRMKGPHVTSKWTFSDVASDGDNVIRYQGVERLASIPHVFNIFETRIRHFTTGGSVTLWTHPNPIGESDVPTIGAFQTKTFWATYPNPSESNNAKGVNAWTATVLGTDVKAGSSNDPLFPDVAATYLTVANTDLGNSFAIELTSTAPFTLYLTLQARGTPITEDDPDLVSVTRSASVTKYGERFYPTKAMWVPNNGEGLEWAFFNAAIYDEPIPFVALEFNGNKNLFTCHAALKLQVSDRITIKATGNSGLGLNEAFFVERIERRVRPGKEFWVRIECSPADVYGGFLVLDDTTLGLLDTGRLAY